MPDQSPPEVGELFRAISLIRDDQRAGFAALNARLDRLVTVDVYESNNRRVDDRLRDLTEDIQSERDARKVELAAEKRAREAQFDKVSTWVRWLVVAIVVPIGLFVASLVIDRSGPS